MLNSLASGTTRTVLAEIMHWALPRLAVYAGAAVAAMAAFVGGAAVYAYVVPLPPPDLPRPVPAIIVPISPQLMMVNPGTNEPPQAIPTSRYSDDLIVGRIVLVSGAELGRVVRVNRDDTGTARSLALAARSLLAYPGQEGAFFRSGRDIDARRRREALQEYPSTIICSPEELERLANEVKKLERPRRLQRLQENDAIEVLNEAREEYAYRVWSFYCTATFLPDKTPLPDK